MEDILLPIHLTTLALLFLVVLYTDHLGFSWLRGKQETLPKRKMNILHQVVWAGLIIIIISGAFMAFPLRDYLFYTPAFYFKMFFVLALVINAFFIGRILHVASERPYASLTRVEKTPLFVSGVVSTASWTGAVISALLMGL
ncbi:hypothetical protein KTR10_01910 [Candidatus Kaiserbacteria bacterium]|nr:hypothetical protein [Candidatus Kaiserbacteria bacterium]